MTPRPVCYLFCQIMVHLLLLLFITFVFITLFFTLHLIAISKFPFSTFMHTILILTFIAVSDNTLFAHQRTYDSRTSNIVERLRDYNPSVLFLGYIRPEPSHQMRIKNIEIV